MFIIFVTKGRFADGMSLAGAAVISAIIFLNAEDAKRAIFI